MARLRASWRTSLPVVQQPRNPQSESIARSPYEKLATGLGADLDGMLCEHRVFDEAGLLPVPDYLSDAEAAALPCAGVTAWSAIVTLGRVRPGDVVVVQGTGGVGSSRFSSPSS